MDKRNESLRLNEQSLASYAYDCYSGSQISLYIGSIWVDDAVAIAFTLSDPKTPVYGYASKYYSLVAQGNRVIQGQLTVAYTEDGYFSAIMNRVRDEQVFYGGEGPLGSDAIGQSPLAITEAGEQLSSASGGWGDGGVNQVLERIRNVDAALVKVKAVQPQTQIEKDLAFAYEKERESLIKMSDTGNKYTRATLQQRMTDVTGVSSYEDALEGMEDQALDPNYRGQFAVKNPWLIVEGFRGAQKMRRPVEHDLVMSRTNEKVPYETIGDGFDIILGYGDLGSGAAEHTVKVLRDVHIVSEGQVIEANGNPIFEVYQFFARDIAPIEDLTTVESSTEALGGNATENITSQSTTVLDSDLVTDIKLAVYAFKIDGTMGASVLDQTWKLSENSIDKDKRFDLNTASGSETYSAALSVAQFQIANLGGQYGAHGVLTAYTRGGAQKKLFEDGAFSQTQNYVVRFEVRTASTVLSVSRSSIALSPKSGDLTSGGIYNEAYYNNYLVYDDQSFTCDPNKWTLVNYIHSSEYLNANMYRQLMQSNFALELIRKITGDAAAVITSSALFMIYTKDGTETELQL